MALKECKACGHEISITAKFCPHCGDDPYYIAPLGSSPGDISGFLKFILPVVIGGPLIFGLIIYILLTLEKIF